MNPAAALETDGITAPPAPLWKRRWFQNTAIVFLGILGLYALIYHDIVSRAHESYNQAELYMQWAADPVAKQKHFDDIFASSRAELEQQLAQKAIAEKDYRRRLDALEFDRDFAMSESSLKYAYQWYKDTYELFSPPESRWVREARKKAPDVLAKWKQELRSQNVPFEDTMFE